MHVAIQIDLICFRERRAILSRTTGRSREGLATTKSGASRGDRCVIAERLGTVETAPATGLMHNYESTANTEHYWCRGD